jgi:hypothetical protein
MHPIGAEERTEGRNLLARLGLGESLPLSMREGGAGEGSLPAALPDRIARPVVVASPGDALKSAADSVFEKGWTSRLAFLALREAPTSAADQFLARSDELYVAEGLTSDSRTKGVGAFAMTTLGVPEGVDEGPAFGEFLTVAQAGLRRREMSAGLFRTAGAIGAPEYPPGAVVGAPTDTEASVRLGRARVVAMRRGITDVGMLAVALFPAPAVEKKKAPRPR